MEPFYLGVIIGLVFCLGFAYGAMLSTRRIRQAAFIARKIREAALQSKEGNQ